MNHTTRLSFVGNWHPAAGRKEEAGTRTYPGYWKRTQTLRAASHDWALLR